MEPSQWRVLVVDDEFDNLNIVQMVLTHCQSQVFAATNGEEGLALIEKENPTFVLLDLQMPGMSGWEVFRRIKSKETTCKLPVIALTAYAMPGDRERILATGFNGYIAKPLQILDLVQQIQSFLS